MRHPRKTWEAIWQKRVDDTRKNFLVKTVVTWFVQNGIMYLIGSLYFGVWNPFYYPASFLPFALGIIIIQNTVLALNMRKKEKEEFKFLDSYYIDLLNRFDKAAEKHNLSRLQKYETKDGVIDFKP